MKERWWTTPMEGEHGGTIMVSGRDYLEKIMESGKFPNLIRVSWKYNAQGNGLPDTQDAELMERVSEALETEFHADKCAWLVAVYTGEGLREWIFYAGNLNIFNKVFNRALEDIETIPIEITAESDPDWEEYKEMRGLSYIPENEDEK
ncbi:MAG: DUF695 domain-containing protein [Candidatus Amulumruptor caecigallinarius]|nr:DUF695 domain-containing protein [Candidatus Amulumruptor caecigallinarius]